MPPRVPYDDFADIYDAWCASAPITHQNYGFYVRKLVDSPGPVVELGVGNGRICIEVAKQKRPIFGIDSSGAILDLCRKRARAAGVSDRLTLIQADFRDFAIPEPADLVVLPFHSIGHLLTSEDRLRAMRQVLGQLVPGGRFIFDHFVFDPRVAVPGVPHLRAEFRDPESGRDQLLWETSTRDMEHQIIRIIVWTDDIDQQGNVVNRRYRRINFSWITPEQSASLLEEAGFEIEALFGDFQEGAFGESSTHQIWVARRP